MSPTIDRRRFLTTIAAASLGAFPSAGKLLAAEPRRKMTIDLTPGAIGIRATLPEAIALAHRFGFESVAPDAGYLASLSDAQLHDLAADMKAKSLVFGASGLTVNFRGDEATFETGMKSLGGSAQALQRAGVTRVGTWISPTHRSLTYLANFKQHAQRLRKVAEVLDGHGLRLGLEYVGPKTSWTSARYPFIHTMAEMKELIAEIGRGNVGFVLDSWHWYTAGETEADLLSLSGHDVVACDLNDAPAAIPVDQQKDGTRELPCATGVIDVKTFLGALVKLGYDGPVRAEPFKADLRKMPNDQAVAVTAEAIKRAFALIG